MAYTEDDAPEQGQSATVSQALRRLKLAQSAVEKQEKRETEALRFQVPELQWDPAMAESRRAAVVDGITIPPRPMLSIPKLNQPVQLVLNQEKAAHLGVNVSPLSEDAEDDTAEVIRDLYRREEQRSRAGLARSWAFDRAVKAGRGAYKIDTDWDDESDNPFDQRVVWKRILHQGSVYFDPASQEPDFSDGEYAFELSWLPFSKFKREYTETLASTCDNDTLSEFAEVSPEWVQLAKDAGKEHAVLVLAYWRKEYETREWVVLDDGGFAYRDEVPEGRQLHADPKLAKTRSVQVPTVIRSIIAGGEEIGEPEPWNGRYIPLIPVIGVELQPFDDERRWQGVVEPSMGAQRLFNYAASSAVELAATETKAPYMMWEGQDEGFEEMWRQAAVRNFPALKVHPVIGPHGELLPAPVRSQVDVGRLGPSMTLLEKADQFIQASTTTLDQGRIEQMGRRRVAHQTIDALQEQSDLGNSHYLHNLATISMPYEAKVVIDLFSRIYDRQGRVARLLDFEDNERTVMLNRPFVMDPRSKRPVAAPEGQQDDRVKHFDLTKGRYGMSVTIGKSWQDRMQQASTEIGEILTSDPALMPLIGPTYFKYRDFPGSKEIAELLKKVRAQQFPGLDDDEQQMQQRSAQLAQENGQLKTQLNDAVTKLNQDFAKHQAQIEVEKVKAELQRDLKVLDNAGKLAVEEVKANIKGVQIQQQAEHEAMALDHKHAHETSLATADAAHEELMAERAHQQAQDLAAQQAAAGMVSAEQGQAHALEQGAQGHQQTLESQQQAADLAPKPEAGA